MLDLADRIAVSIPDPRCEPWFPELTKCLTLHEWKRLRKDIGIVPETYSTARMLRGNALIPREIESLEYASLKTLNIKIEAAHHEWADSYRIAGVRFYSTDEIENTAVLECIGDALSIISQIPSLISSVQALVRSLHVLKPFDTDHDLSFSEPQIPFSIFVSVFEERVPNDALRVAEAIVHETMHLQLTLIEQALAIVEPSRCKHFSPWRREMRSSRGLLHAVYVFSVIHHFLSRLISSEEVSSKFIEARRSEIVNQMSQVGAFEQCQALTPIGRRFIRRMLTLSS